MIKKLAYVAASIIIVLAILVATTRLLTPLLDNHRADFEKWASELLDLPIKIDHVQVSWQQYQPVISLNKVTVLDKDNLQESILEVGKVKVFFSIPQSIWQRKIIPATISLADAKVTVTQSATGDYVLQGFSSLSTMNKGETKFSEVMAWLSTQPSLRLENIDIHFEGYHEKQRFITIENLSVKNDSGKHVFLGKGILHQDVPTEIELAVQWPGDNTDINKINANLYLYVAGFSISQWVKDYSWQGWQVKDGMLSAKIWANWNQGRFTKIQTTFQSYNLSLYSEATKST